MPRRPTHSLSILGALGLLALFALGSALVAGVAIGVEMLRHGATLADAARALRSDVLLLSVSQLGGVALALGVGVIVVHGSDARFRDALDLRPVPAAISMLALTAGFALQFPLSELANLLSEIAPSFAQAQDEVHRLVHIDSVGDAIAIPLAIVAIPAVSEELLFRGLFLPALGRRYGNGLGLALSSILFGLVHGAPVAIVYASLAGLVLGVVRLRTGSVLPCIALHGAFNAVPVLLPPELVRIEGFNTVGSGVYHLPLAVAVGSALVCAVSLAAMTRLTSDAPDDRRE